MIEVERRGRTQHYFWVHLNGTHTFAGKKRRTGVNASCGGFEEAQ